jgi:hypothetical protein
VRTLNPLVAKELRRLGRSGPAPAPHDFAIWTARHAPRLLAAAPRAPLANKFSTRRRASYDRLTRAGMEPYAPRPIRFHGLIHHGDWTLKSYSLRYGEDPVDHVDFARGTTLLLGDLPSPAVADGRPGIGLCLAHQGRGGRYAVLAWWEHENELPLRIAVRRPGQSWRRARGDESICVWDLEVLTFERDAYVATVLAPESDPRGYLARHLESG